MRTKSSIVSNEGMISIPAEIRRKYNIQPGDKVVFMETEDGIVLVPVVPMKELINPNEKDVAIKMVRELERERREEALKE